MSVKMKFGSKDIPFVYKGDKLVYPNPIKDGLLLWYDFKGMKNTDTNKEIAKDLSGNGNDGTLTNFNFTEESGYKDNTLVFDGVDDSLTIPEIALDETAMSVVHDDKIYSYEDDKMLTVGEDGEIIRGGKNLLVGTTQINLTARFQYQSGTVNIDGKKAVWFNGERANNIIFIGGDYPLTEGEEYNFSFYAKASTNLSVGRVYMNGGNSGFLTNQEITTQWKRYSFSFISNNSDNVGIHLYPKIRNDDGTYEDFYITDWALTKGKKLLPLTLSPQDYKTTTLSPASLTDLQLYNKTLNKTELLYNAESKGLRKLKPGVVVQDGLVLHYDFSHESNTSEYKGKAFDYSGSGNHGVLENFNFTEESGYVGNKLKFDGVDDRVLMVSPGAESKDFLSSEMTIVWSGIIRETQAKSGINQILSAGYVNGWALGYHGQVDNLMYTVRDSNTSTGYHIRYLNRPPLGEFFTFAMTFKKGEVIAYLNGIERNKTVDTGDIIYSTYPAVEITRQAHQTTASCKIYNRILTPEEIAHNYQIEKEKFNIV